MAILTEKRGRPYYVARVPFSNDRKLAFMDEFYNITRTFHYREIMALSRALNVTPVTVQNWKYKTTFPKWDIAYDVIDWYRNGKPMDLVYQRDKITGML
jgi:hypothetical protein